MAAKITAIVMRVSSSREQILEWLAVFPAIGFEVALIGGENAAIVEVFREHGGTTSQSVLFLRYVV
ncbi:MAG: hypothetical protein ABIP64_04470 [Burkholderiales bacterium]